LLEGAEGCSSLERLKKSKKDMALDEVQVDGGLVIA
jgi:hypothetical protein